MFKWLIAILVLTQAPAAIAGRQDDSDLYRVTMLRAAPGEWYALKSLIESQGEPGSEDDQGRMIPYRIRHSQGDQWDFMLIQPVSSWEHYFSAQSQALEAPFRTAAQRHADFAEDWFVAGPAHHSARELFAGAGLFHLEIYRARAGMKEALEDSRIRENAIFADLGALQNTIWLGQFGADHDVMTIGFHKSWASYAAHNATGSDEEWEALSRRHGYAGSGDLAPQLRSYLTGHADTFAVPLQ